MVTDEILDSLEAAMVAAKEAQLNSPEPVAAKLIGRVEALIKSYRPGYRGSVSRPLGQTARFGRTPPAEPKKKVLTSSPLPAVEVEAEVDGGGEPVVPVADKVKAITDALAAKEAAEASLDIVLDDPAKYETIEALGKAYPDHMKLAAAFSVDGLRALAAKFEVELGKAATANSIAGKILFKLNG